MYISLCIQRNEELYKDDHLSQPFELYSSERAKRECLSKSRKQQGPVGPVFLVLAFMCYCFFQVQYTNVVGHVEMQRDQQEMLFLKDINNMRYF